MPQIGVEFFFKCKFLAFLEKDRGSERVNQIIEEIKKEISESILTFFLELNSLLTRQIFDLLQN